MRWARLEMTEWLLARLLTYFAIAMLILFQPEIRRRLTPADLAVTVDLNGTAAEESLVHLTGSEMDAPPGAQVVRISASEIDVRLVPRAAMDAGTNGAPQ